MLRERSAIRTPSRCHQRSFSGFRPSWLLPPLLIAAVTAVGCNNGAPATGTTQGELASTEQCGTLAADAVLKGGGAVRSSATYGRSQCFDGYLVDINNYSARYTEGTRVPYGRIAPTTQAACENIEVRAYIFKKNSDGTAPFMTNKIQRGVWLTDVSSGVGRCSTPSILLERDIPGYVPGGSYRLALRAAQRDPYVRQEVYVETQRPYVPLSAAQQF